MLKVRDLFKQYQTHGSEPAGGVFGVSFDVAAGEMFTLLGPSGCGKTTTLRSIAGLEQPDAGSITLDGVVLFDSEKRVAVPMYDRDIGMVFQSYAIWPHMSVFENVAYPLRVARRNKPSKAEIVERVERVLKAVDLSGYKHRSATQLSGGQQQRLALARALVRRPKLLLLDEPLSNLDAQLREQMRGELKSLQIESGVTTVYVTHDQAEAMAISDRIAILDKGRIAQIGTPDSIYDRPRSEFVANFIGRTNLFHGQLQSSVTAGQRGVVTSPLGDIVCSFPEDAAQGADIAFVIRPENIVIHLQNETAGQNSLEGKIVSRVFLGEIAEYTIEINPKQRVLARARPDLSIGVEGRVRFEMPADRTIAICA